MTSPSDQMFARMDQSAFACVPRYLVEEYNEILRQRPETITLEKITEHKNRLNAAAVAIADAALDDIS